MERSFSLEFFQKKKNTFRAIPLGGEWYILVFIEKTRCHARISWLKAIYYQGNSQNYFIPTGPTIPQKRWWYLSVPSIPHLQRCCLGCTTPVAPGVKTEKKIETFWIVSLAMQASCKQNINDSCQILRPINSVHAVYQIGGVLYNLLPLNMQGSIYKVSEG